MGDLFQQALVLQFSEDGESDTDPLFSDVRSQEIQLAPEKVRSSEKPPPEPPPRVNIQGVRFFGCEFYRCFVTKFSKILKSIAQLLCISVTFKITDNCLEIFCRIKTNTDSLEFIRGGEVLFEKVNTPHLFLRGLKRSS